MLLNYKTNKLLYTLISSKSSGLIYEMPSRDQLTNNLQFVYLLKLQQQYEYTLGIEARIEISKIQFTSTNTVANRINYHVYNNSNNKPHNNFL